MGWRVLVTARHFDWTDEPTRYLIESGCERVPSEFGGARSDGTVEFGRAMGLLDGVDAAIVGAFPFSRQVLAASPTLKCISRRGVGYDNVDVQAATERSIIVTITAHAVDTPVADHTFALMLAAARRVVEGHGCLATGGWQAFMGVDVWQKTLGIVGLGRIGRAVARRAQGFDMHVLAYDIVQDEERARWCGAQYVTFEDLLRVSDFISIHVPLLEGTRHLIDEAAFRLMKPSTILINTARGGVVDEEALMRSLKDRQIRGAAIDTFEKEPALVAEWTTMENVVLTPHTAGYTEESMAAANLLAAKHVVSLMHGHLPDAESVLNPDAWQHARGTSDTLPSN